MGKGRWKKSRKNKMALIMSNISYAVFLLAMGSESIEGGDMGDIEHKSNVFNAVCFVKEIESNMLYT